MSFIVFFNNDARAAYTDRTHDTVKQALNTSVKKRRNKPEQVYVVHKKSTNGFRVIHFEWGPITQKYKLVKSKTMKTKTVRAALVMFKKPVKYQVSDRCGIRRQSSNGSNRTYTLSVRARTHSKTSYAETFAVFVR